VSLRVSGGRRLRSPPGELARPTAARVRLAVINRLAPRLAGCRWLDLCCGSGAMACEALQHGAAQVWGVERDRRIAAVARANLEAVAAGRRDRPDARVVSAEVLAWLERRREPAATGFDVIYVDPPYAAGLYGPIGERVRRGGWLRSGGTMVWECASQSPPEPPRGWQLVRRARYGGTTLLFLELGPANDPANEPTNDPPRGVEGGSAAQGAAAAVLIPGGDEQARQGDGNQAENDAAEEGFDHGWEGILGSQLVEPSAILP
jgi:16S rRNA (guanine966-N2)-methyltransferase